MRSQYLKFFLAIVVMSGLPLLCSCQARVGRIDENRLIDSFIRINRISHEVVLVSFGPDAVTAINTSEGIVVIDAGISSGLTLKFMRVIEEEFQNNHFGYVIITHAHPDHYGGCRVFGEAIVVGHENGMNEISIQWEDRSKVIGAITAIVSEYENKLSEYLQGSPDWNDSFTQLARYKGALKDAREVNEIIYPEVIFSDTLHLVQGNINVELIHFGNCHSRSDILVYIPEKKLLFTGDLFFKHGRLSINRSYIADKERWIRAIQWIETRIPNIETIISGHGEVLSTEDLSEFFKKVQGFTQ